LRALRNLPSSGGSRRGDGLAIYGEDRETVKTQEVRHLLLKGFCFVFEAATPDSAGECGRKVLRYLVGDPVDVDGTRHRDDEQRVDLAFS